jgi:dUTPase
MNSELHPLNEILTIQGAGGHNLPYLGYIEANLKIQNSKDSENPYLFFVVPDTTYNKTTPVLVGTNVLKPIKDRLNTKLGVQYIQRSDLPVSLQVALQNITIQERHMRRSNGVFGIVKMDSSIVVPSQKSLFVEGYTRLTIPVSSRIAYLQPLTNLPDGIEITPGLVGIDNNMHRVEFEICNHSDRPVRLQSGANMCELQVAQVEDPETHDLTKEQFSQQFTFEELDQNQKEIAHNLLWKWRNIFSHSSLDLGCTDVSKHRI